MLKFTAKTSLPALAVAVILSGPLATEPAAPAIQSAQPLHLATIMCGSNGCNAVQTKQQHRRKFQTLGHG
jgi:hypothetical protein